MSATEQAEPPMLAGRIGITLLCIYLLGVTVRISGCYAPEGQPRDELPGAGPAVGSAFPSFRLREASGTQIGLDDLAGAPVVVIVVPSLDWSPPTKAQLLDLAAALPEERDHHVVVIMPGAQATPRALRFVRDRHLPFYFLIDDAELITALGLATRAPDGTAAALPAIFVLDDAGRVVVRDVRKQPRSWLAAEAVLAPPPSP
jgi:peroxiredoxin